jgi:hypothetical protein
MSLSHVECSLGLESINAREGGLVDPKVQISTNKYEEVKKQHD